MPYKDIEKRYKNRKEYRKKHPEIFKKSAKKYKLKSLYNLTFEEYNKILKKQDLKCAICGQPLDLQNPHGVNIDHSHKTGKVRGILCNRCNLAIGLLRENPEYIYNAYKYLKNEIL